MVLADDRILEWASVEGNAKATEMADSGLIRDYTASYLTQRLKELSAFGLMRDLGNGVYVITEKGLAYLDGRYDVETGEWLDENGEPVRGVPEKYANEEHAG